MDEIPDQDLRYIFGPAYERVAMQAAVTSTHPLYAFSLVTEYDYTEWG